MMNAANFLKLGSGYGEYIPATYLDSPLRDIAPQSKVFQLPSILSKVGIGFLYSSAETRIAT